MRRWMPWLALLVVLVGALVIGSRDGDGDAGESGTAARTRRITEEIRCPTCRSQSAADSDAPAAEAIRLEVGRRVEAGQSDGSIRAYLVSRYGKDILLRPESSGVSALVWAVPVVALVGAVAGLVVAFRRWRAAWAT